MISLRFLNKVSSRWIGAASVLLALVSINPAFAQNPTNGRTLYNAILVTGKPTCASSICHGSGLTLNRIENGANNPGAIAAAINTQPKMAFLIGKLSSSGLADLAAYIANPSAALPLPVATLSHTSLDFGTANLGTTTSLRLMTITNTGLAPLNLSDIVIDNPEFARVFGTCPPVGVLPVYSSCSMGINFTPLATGTRTGMLRISHNAAVPTSTVSLVGIGAGAPETATTFMIEYYYPSLDYYFITSRLADITLLDSMPSWQRTGRSFKVLTSSVTGTTGINRYYFDQIALNNTRGSHFYTVNITEKEGLAALNPLNISAPGQPHFEGIDSYAFTPLVEGIGGYCASGQTPVYRLFRNVIRFPDNPNHRFTTDVNLYNSFVALGWDGEGVKICVPN